MPSFDKLHEFKGHFQKSEKQIWVRVQVFARLHRVTRYNESLGVNECHVRIASSNKEALVFVLVQEFLQVTIKQFRVFHHGGMATFVDKAQFRVRNQSIEFMGHEWRGNSVI